MHIMVLQWQSSAVLLTHYMGTTGAALGLSVSCTDTFALPGTGIFSRTLLLLATSAEVRQTIASRTAKPPGGSC